MGFLKRKRNTVSCQLHSLLIRRRSFSKMSGEKHSAPWTEVFNDLAKSSDPMMMHQISGWGDIEQQKVWDGFVNDILDGIAVGGVTLPEEGKIFEGGCGVLAFMSIFARRYPKWQLHGVDGSTAAIKRLPELNPTVDASNFKAGYVPEALADLPSDTYDVTACNSVLQYVAVDHSYTTMKELLRMTKPGGLCIIGDLVDVAHKETNEPAMEEHWSKQGYGTGVPKFSYFCPQELKDTFEPLGKVWIDKVKEEGYWRRAQRFNLYIQKN